MSDFLKLFLSDSEPAVLLAAIGAVNSVSIEADEPLLDRFEVLMMSGPPEVRSAARRLFFNNIAPPSDPKRLRLLRLLTSRDRDLRIRAAARLAIAGDFSGIELAMAELREPLPMDTPDGYDDSFRALTSLVSGSKDERAAPVLWTLAHCRSLAESQRQTAHGALLQLYTRPAPGGQRAFVPGEYRDVSYRPCVRAAWGV